MPRPCHNSEERSMIKRIIIFAITSALLCWLTHKVGDWAEDKYPADFRAAAGIPPDGAEIPPPSTPDKPNRLTNELPENPLGPPKDGHTTLADPKAQAK